MTSGTYGLSRVQVEHNSKETILSVIDNFDWPMLLCILGQLYNTQNIWKIRL